MSYVDPNAVGSPYRVNPYGGSPYGAAPQPGPVYVPGLGVVQGGHPAWIPPASQAYAPLARPTPVPFDYYAAQAEPQPLHYYGAPAEPQMFDYGGLQPLDPQDDWGAANEGFDVAAGADPYGAMTMHPYAGVDVDQTMSPEYHALHPEFYSQEAADAWTRAHMTPAQIEAEHLRQLEEQYGPMNFWRTIGRGAWQGITLGWGDEAVAWYESQRRGTRYEDELALQRGTNEALRSVDPRAFGIAEGIGTIVPQTGLTMLPWARVASPILQRMIQLGIGGAATGALNTTGEMENRTPATFATHALAGALATGPAAFLGPAYLAPWWNSFPSTFLRDRIVGSISLAPGSAVRSQISADQYGY